MRRRSVDPILLAAVLAASGVTVACRDDTHGRVVALPATVAAEDVLLDVVTHVGRVSRGDNEAGPRMAGIQPARSRGRRWALAAPSPSSIEYDVTVPPDAIFRFGTAVARDEAREGTDERLAVRFRVRIDGESLWERVWDSTQRGSHRRHWVDAEVDLGRFAGRDVVVALETEPVGGVTGVATPAWSRVQLVRRTTVPRQRSSSTTPNVLLLVVDTLRSDRLGSYGASPTRTPNLDRLAATGVVFRNTWAQAPWTLPSVATILTGRYPRSHGVVGRSAEFGRPAGFGREGNWAYLPDTVPTIASLVRRAGISTFGVTSNLLISRENNLARGFETFVELPVSPMPVQWARASMVRDVFAEWLAVNGQNRFFAYLHFMEPHDPYVPAPGLRERCPDGAPSEVCDGVVRTLARARERGEKPLDEATVRYLESLYDGEVLAWDAELPRLLGVLDRYGVRERTVILITADHGEEFGEHGHLGHRKQLYAESLAVPLIMAGPGVPSGVRTDLAELVDVLPTIAEILTDDVLDEALPGHDLLRGDTQRQRTFAETRYGIVEAEASPVELLGVREGHWTYLRAPSVPNQRLHDTKADPGETVDIASDHPGVCADLRGTVEGWVAATPAPEATATQGEQLTEKLRALGYVE